MPFCCLSLMRSKKSLTDFLSSCKLRGTVSTGTPLIDRKLIKMSRKRTKKRYKQRETKPLHDFTKQSLLFSSQKRRKLVRHPFHVKLNLQEIQDYRKDYDQYPKTIFGTDATYGERIISKPFTKPRYATYFDNPRDVVVCKRRRERRQVLFAKKKAGKGKKTTDKRIFNENSKIRCK